MQARFKEQQSSWTKSRRAAKCRRLYEICPRKDKRGIGLISDSSIVLGGTAALHTCGVGGGLFFGCLPPVFDCRMTEDLATSIRTAEMKTILMLIVGLVLAGCGSMEHHVHNGDAAGRNRYVVEHNAVDTICACP